MPIDFLRIVGGAGSIVWHEWIAKKRCSWWLLSENFQHWPPLFLPIISRTNTYKYKRRSFGASSPQSFWCSNRYVRVNACTIARWRLFQNRHGWNSNAIFAQSTYLENYSRINYNRTFFWKLCTEALPRNLLLLTFKRKPGPERDREFNSANPMDYLKSKTDYMIRSEVIIVMSSWCCTSDKVSEHTSSGGSPTAENVLLLILLFFSSLYEQRPVRRQYATCTWKRRETVRGVFRRTRV